MNTSFVSKLVVVAVVVAALICLGLFLTFGKLGSSGGSSWELTGISFGGPPQSPRAPNPLFKRPKGEPTSNSLVNQITEPSYQSEPFYCQLAFGSSRDFLMLTAADLEARVLYADLNFNGDLTEAGEAFAIEETGRYQQTVFLTSLVPEISAGENTHTNLTIKFGQTGGQVRGVFSVQLWGWSESTTDADLVPLEMTSNSDTIPLLHFDGPLTMGNYRKVVEMPRGQESKFYSLIGTAGESGGTLTAIDNSEIDGEAHPKVEFEFPHKDPSKAPIKVEAFLRTRC